MSMNRAEVLALFDREQRAEISFPEARREQAANVVRLLRPAPAMNAVVYSQLEESNADAVIQAQVDYFRPIGQRFSWRMCSHDTPADLPARLEQHGFQFDESGDVMVLDLNQVPGELLEPVQNPAVEIRKIDQRDQLEDVIRIMEAVWGGNFGWMRQRLGGHLEIPGYLSMYVAYMADQPVSAGWTYFHPNSSFAGLWGGSTLADYRKQGLYTAILAVRTQEALARGRRFLVIDAGPMSRPIVARYGFEYLTTSIDYEWKGS